MEVDQLIKGIGAAVALAESQNGCIFPCLTKSEWASWVQAFGSIAAIFGAAWASMRPIKYEHKRKEKAQRAEAAIIGVSLLSNLKSAVDALVKFRGKYDDIPVGTNGQFVTELSNILKIGGIPDQEFCLRMVHVDDDFAKSMAIALESLRQLKPHLERCKDQKFNFVKGVFNPLLVYTDYYINNLCDACSSLTNFVEGEGVSVTQKS